MSWSCTCGLRPEKEWNERRTLDKGLEYSSFGAGCDMNFGLRGQLCRCVVKSAHLGILCVRFNEDK